MGSATGARKAAAARIGVPLAEYDARVMRGEKWCMACKRWHRRRAFGRDASRTDGLASRCFGSRISTTPDDPGARERRLASARGMAWCSECSAFLLTSDVRQGKCREHRNSDYRARYATDGESIRQRVYARKRRLAAIPGWWVDELRDGFAGLCAYGCGRPATSSDHIWPVKLGGESAPGNLAPACTPCNSRKSDAHPWAWIDKGFAAFPDEWADIVALARKDNGNPWVEEWLEACA